jgi:glucokinase
MPRLSTKGLSPTSRARRRARASSLVLGIDLGATKVVSGLVAPDGTIVRHSGRHLHANVGPGGVIRTIVRSARACLGEEYKVPPRIGIAVAGQVDPRTGTVVHSPNLGWRDVPLSHRLREELNVPIVVVNDARAAALAEWKHGAGVGATDMFLLALGTGVGGSAVVGGRLLEGGSHACGEIGHMTIVVGGRKCHCPNWGCLEAYVGGWAIAERAREAVRADPTGGAFLLERAGSAELITAQTVFHAYRSGDPLSGRLVRETERFLADGAISIVNAFNPSVLVIAGGLIAGMPSFLPIVESAIRARCQPPAAGTRVVLAKLGEDAALVGAADAARLHFAHR